MGSFNKARQGQGSDRQDFLTFYNGYGTTELRVPGTVIDTGRTLLSIFGTIQPEILISMMNDRLSPDGLWFRFLMVSQPLSPARLLDDDGKIEIKDLLVNLYQDISRMPAKQYRLSDESYRYFQPIYNQIEIKRCQEPNPTISGYYAKLPGSIARLALNLHLIREIVEFNHQPPRTEIPLETLRKAVRLGSFFLEQVKLIDSQYQATQGDLAPQLLAILQRSKQSGWVSARTIQSSIFALRKTKSEQIREMFLQLESLGYGVCRYPDGNRNKRLEFRAL